jgi:hypothetical protein
MLSNNTIIVLTAWFILLVYTFYWVGAITAEIEFHRRELMSFSLFMIVAHLWPLYWVLRGIQYLWRKL